MPSKGPSRMDSHSLQSSFGSNPYSHAIDNGIKKKTLNEQIKIKKRLIGTHHDFDLDL